MFWRALHPDLRIDEWVRAAFYAVSYARQQHPWPSLAEFDNWMLTTFALLTCRLPEDRSGSGWGGGCNFRAYISITCTTRARPSRPCPI